MEIKINVVVCFYFLQSNTESILIQIWLFISIKERLFVCTLST